MEIPTRNILLQSTADVRRLFKNIF